MDTLITFGALIAFYIVLAGIFKALLNFRLKKYIIHSENAGKIDFKEILKSGMFNEDSLKWGLVLLFGGIGLIVIDFSDIKTEDSPLPYGIEAVFVSLGFLLYYVIVSRKR